MPPSPARATRALGVLGLIASAGFGSSGCTAVVWMGVQALYEPAELPSSQVSRDLVYVRRPGPDGIPVRLDLYRPAGQGWPVVIFAYGGGWRAGRRNLRIAGADVYGNIGRFFAARGVGVAVIDYRLQPRVTWREQVDDVAAALAWVHRHIGAFGGDADDIFLAGHSAGAQLASFVSVHRELLAAHGLRPESIRGVIAVSAAGVDLADERQYELGASRQYFRQRFRAGDPTEGWRTEASVLSYIHAAAPSFLFLYGAQDPAWVQWQTQRLYSALRSHGAYGTLETVAGENHFSMVLALSRRGEATDAMLEFIAEQRRRARLAERLRRLERPRG